MSKLVAVVVLAASTLAGQCLPQESIDMLAAVNALRAEHGLSQLTPDTELTRIASIRALEIATDYSHAGAQRFGVPGRGELLCRVGCAEDVVSWCMQAFRDSPSHLGTMLSSRWTKIGVAGVKVTTEQTAPDEDRSCGEVSYFAVWLE